LEFQGRHWKRVDRRSKSLHLGFMLRYAPSRRQPSHQSSPTGEIIASPPWQLAAQQAASSHADRQSAPQVLVGSYSASGKGHARRWCGVAWRGTVGGRIKARGVSSCLRCRATHTPTSTPVWVCHSILIGGIDQTVARGCRLSCQNHSIDNAVAAGLWAAFVAFW